MRKRNSKGGVMWLLPKGKRPIAYSTVAASDLIVELAQEYETILEIYNAINYDIEAKEVLAKYITAGYGGTVARKIFA